MDESRFDALARSLATSPSRRRMLIALAAGLLSSPLGRRPPSAAAACKRVGQNCDQNGDCCAGAECAGGACQCKNGKSECGGKCYKVVPVNFCN